jgi:hypothetical protein
VVGDLVAFLTDRGVGVTHGVAVKLVNVCLKSGFVCAGQHQNACVKSLHPPIDSQLVNQLYKSNVGDLRREWGQAKNRRWSKFTSEQYENVIGKIRWALGKNVPLWWI